MVNNNMAVIEQAVQETRDSAYYLRKQYMAVSNDELIIKAAKLVAKNYKISHTDILKCITPSANVAGSKSWNKDGRIITIK